MSLSKTTDPRGGRVHVGVRASKTVSTASGTSEAGIGAVMPWADRLWFVTYPDNNGAGAGTGLWSMGDDLVPHLVAETQVTTAARIVFNSQMFIGPHAIATDGTVTPITGFAAGDRIAAYAKTGTNTNLYALTMAGDIYTVDPATKVAALVRRTYVGSGPPTDLGASGSNRPHGKAMWGHGDGNNIFYALNGNSPDGRLARFNRSNNQVADLDPGHNSWVEVAGCYEFNKHIFAFGTDGLAVMMWLFDGLTYSDTPAQKFRIPLPSDQQLGYWQQEWMRLRQVQTERYLLGVHGGFFQLSPVLHGTDVAGTDLPRMEPICRYASTFEDFTFWNGYLVLSGDQTSLQSGNLYPNSGQPQSGLVLCGMEDLWSWGEPQGVGGWYSAASVTGSTISDLMLARGYKRRSIHFANDTGTSVDVDILAYGRTNTARLVDTVTVPANGFIAYQFPDAFSADWLAVRPTTTCTSFSASLRCNV